MRNSFLALLMLAALPPGNDPKARSEDPPPSIRIALTPGGMASETPSHVDVKMVLSGIASGAERPFLRVPIIIASVHAAIYKDGDVDASDDAGPLPLKMTEDLSDATGFFQWRLFTVGRPTNGNITLRYRASITPAMSARRPGPSFDLRGYGGGFGGAGSGFLILPIDDSRPYQIDLDWDLRQIAPGARGVSTLGTGHVMTEGSSMTLLSTFLLAGPLGCFPPDAGNAPFNAYWLHEPNFDALADATWAAESYSALLAFFHESNLPPYYLFMRPHPNSRDGGAATEHGFFLEYGVPPQPQAKRRIMFAHEMFHHFVGGLDGPPGTSSWFGEGLAEFYESVIPYRAGLIDADEFLEEQQRDFELYSGNPRNDLPNDRVAEEYWRDSRVQNIPYMRGKAYFIDLNAKIRSASNGRRGLDDLLLAMLESRRRGTGYDERKWRALLGSELGERGIRDFEDMLSGKLIVPPSDAFGPEFERVEYQLNQFQLGFSDRALVNNPRVIYGLIPGSAADKAGLRNGDLIVRADDIELARQKGDPVFNLEVRRGGAIVPIRFSTRGAVVTCYKWRHVPSDSSNKRDALGRSVVGHCHGWQSHQPLPFLIMLL